MRNERIARLEKIRSAGIDPYPSACERTHSIGEALSDFQRLSTGGQAVVLVGRIRALRGHGKIIFGNLEDGSGIFQFAVKADEVSPEALVQFKNYDLGDFVQLSGTLFETQRKEKTLLVKTPRLLSKSLRALPEKFHGLRDGELKLRKRYLDILTNPEVKELFVKKNRFWSSMRRFLVDRDFLEFEMPVLEAVPGGAEAEPFITHHNALDRDFYLRISLELPLKKMLVAGYEKVFEIGRIFRNEGVSTTHLQDYTQMEFYWAYSDFNKLMDFVREMYQHVISETFGTLELASRGIKCDWSGDWDKINYLDLFREWTKIDLANASDAELKQYLDKHHVKYESFVRRGRLIDLIFKRERTLHGEKSLGKVTKPFFLINQPLELEPLAKRLPDNPTLVQRMQVMAYFTELGKGFGELNDPLDQRSRFGEQMKLRDAGDNEAQMLDEDYLEAMEYGMPPAVGFGVSERLFSMLVPPGDRSIREGVVFPLMKEDKD